MSTVHGAPSTIAVALLVPPQNFIEFDPPVRSVEFEYSRWPQARAMWGGMMVNSDSMLVRAMERIPGTTSYNQHDRKVLYSNASAMGVLDQWTPVKFTAGGDHIQWMWFDGWIGIDNLRMVCTPNRVVRGGEVTCKASADEVLEWQFEPDAVVIHPKAGPVQMAGTVEETTDSKIWKGPVVLPGKVTVRVMKGGAPREFSTRIDVLARTWDMGEKWLGRIEPNWGENDIPYMDTNRTPVLGENLHAPTM